MRGGDLHACAVVRAWQMCHVTQGVGVCKDVICLISEAFGANLTPLLESCGRLTAVRFRLKPFLMGSLPRVQT